MQRTARTLLVVTLYGILPNAAFAMAGAFLFLPRAWVNVDYLALGIAALWLPRPVTLGLLAVVTLLDLVFALAPGYHFHPYVAFTALGDMLHWDGFYGGMIVAGSLLGVAILCAFCVWLTPRPQGTERRAIAIVLAGAVVLAGAANLALGKRTESGHQRAATDIATSSLHRIGVIAGRVRRQPDRFFGDPVVVRQGVPSATGPLFERLDRGDPLPSRIWLVIVESLGHFQDPELDRLQWASLLNDETERRFEVRRGSVPFHGSTVPGELRELCRVELSRYPRHDAHVAGLDCLPERLQTRGYRTVAVHGFSGSMFSRTNWYSGLGFDEMHFIHSLWKDVPNRLCGLSFRGLCDADVGALLREQTGNVRSGNEFLYWLTLNGHLPHSGVAESDTPLTCTHPLLRAQPGTVCDLVRLHDVVMRSVFRMLTEAAGEPPLVVMVGDHPPHVLSHDLRKRISESHVPFALLTPRPARVASPSP